MESFIPTLTMSGVPLPIVAQKSFSITDIDYESDVCWFVLTLSVNKAISVKRNSTLTNAIPLTETCEVKR